MKLKAQMAEQKRMACRLKNQAKKENDRDAEMMFLGIMMAMDWVQGSKNDNDFIDLEFKMDKDFSD